MNRNRTALHSDFPSTRTFRLFKSKFIFSKIGRFSGFKGQMPKFGTQNFSGILGKNLGNWGNNSRSAGLQKINHAIMNIKYWLSTVSETWQLILEWIEFQLRDTEIVGVEDLDVNFVDNYTDIWLSHYQ